MWPIFISSKYPSFPLLYSGLSIWKFQTHAFAVTDYGYSCHYNRQIKKRGRARRSDKVAAEGTSSARLTNGDHSHGGGDETRPDGTPLNLNSRGDSHSTSLDSQNSGRRANGADQPGGYAERGPLTSLTSSTPRSTGDGATPFPMDGSFTIEHRPGTLHNGVDGYDQSLRSDAADAFARPPPRPRLLSSTSATGPAPGPATLLNFNLASPQSLDGPTTSGQHGSMYSGCRYRCLDPLLPYLGDTFPVSVACDLLDVFLLDPGTSLFRFSSPYILTRIFRKKSLLHPTNPRQLSPALLATILWCCAQTADISVLLVPGSRSRLTNALYELATSLLVRRDPDRWRRIHGKYSHFVITFKLGD